jgi:hypothetical protein
MNNSGECEHDKLTTDCKTTKKTSHLPFQGSPEKISCPDMLFRQRLRYYLGDITT